VTVIAELRNHWLVHVSSKRQSNAMEDDADTLAFKVEELSSHALTFVPLPWRVALLTGLGILGWASNLQFLHLMSIDTAYVLDMHSHINSQYSRPFSPTSPHFGSTTFPSSGRLLYLALYKLFGIYSAWTFGCWLLFRALCGGDVQMMDKYKIVLEICAIGVLAALVCPFNVIRKRERDLLLQ
jgi:EXS family